MSAAFTPGPWKLGNADIFVDGDDGDDRVICAIGTAGGFRSSIYSPIRANKPEGRANAHLISAAPDLYAALQGALGALEMDYDAGKDSCDSDWEGIAYQRLEAARAALAKASPSARSSECGE